MTTVDEVKTLIEEKRFKITAERRLPNETGTQLYTDCGAIVVVYDTGKLVVQGKNADKARSLFGRVPQRAGVAVSAISHLTKVFVVYGHYMTARTQLEAMLRRWGLEPLILDQLPS